MASYHRIAAWQLQALCRGLGQDDAFADYLGLQRFMMEPWGSRPVPERPPWTSNIGDDHSPYEFSIAFGDRGAELRLLLEAQADRPGLVANQRAGLALTRRLADRYGASLRRFHRIQELFCPEIPQGGFSVWHAVTFGDVPAFKIYLNPQVRGAEHAPELVASALERLGFGNAARIILERAAWRGFRLDELKYFSLDLSDEAHARVKVYLCHHDVSADELERTFSVTPTHLPGDVVEYCKTMVGHTGPFRNKPLSSCLSFVSGNDVPTAVTLHLPIAHYAPNDATVAARVRAFLIEHQNADAAWGELVSSFVARPLGNSVGAQSYASYRREKHGLRLTVYLSPELFSEGLSASRATAR